MSMMIILSEPTEKDIELVKRILGDKSVNVFEIDGTQPEGAKQEWLSPDQFVSEMEKKGYRCSVSKSRKALCDQYGVTYKKRGKHLWFKADEIHKIPSRK